jgi:ABC-2 type transport system ATP-binding protein
LAQAGATIFLSTHSIGVAEEVCHRIGIIQRGRLIACGTMAQLYAQACTKHGNLESVFLELTQEQITHEAASG